VPVHASVDWVPTATSSLLQVFFMFFHRPHLCFLHLNPIVPARCASVNQQARSLQSRMRNEVPILSTAAIRSSQEGPMHVHVSTLCKRETVHTSVP